MSQVVPVQLDVTEPLLALGGEVPVAALAPASVNAVSLEHGPYIRGTSAQLDSATIRRGGSVQPRWRAPFHECDCTHSP